MYLPSFLPKLWQRPSAVAELTLDPWRHILYLRLQGGPIQVWLALAALLIRSLIESQTRAVLQQCCNLPFMSSHSLRVQQNVLSYDSMATDGKDQLAAGAAVVEQETLSIYVWPVPAASLQHARHVTAHAGVQVFDMGSDGSEPTPKRVAEVTDFMTVARAASGGQLLLNVLHRLSTVHIQP